MGMGRPKEITMRIAVTGATGFIGSNLVRRLVTEGHHVTATDNNFRGVRGRLDDLEKDIDFITADLTSEGNALEIVNNVDTVVHLAAINGTAYFYSMPSRVVRTNTLCTLNVLEACKRNGVHSVFVASSSEAYCTPPTIPTPEGVQLVIPDPRNPRYTYSASKIVSEVATLAYGVSDIPNTVVFRPHNVYGPDMGTQHVIPDVTMKFIEAAGGDITMQGNGEQTRAFIYIDDFIDGMMFLLHHAGHREIYNVGTEDMVSIRSVVNNIATFFPGQSATHGAVPHGGTLQRCPDTQKLRSLGWTQRTPFKDGVERTVLWYKEHGVRESIT
jgi:nucleoside-diphosphate-sugar epimerase